jgi:hypothetical protein
MESREREWLLPPPVGSAVEGLPDGLLRAAADTRPTSKRLLIHEPFPALRSSQPQDFL